MENPFSDKGHEDIIVVLNGVSGPGTFGLAEVLTGGSGAVGEFEAEALLKQINDQWKKREPDRHTGVEAIVRTP